MSQNRRGFTLIELVIMIAIGGILSLGLGKAAGNLIKMELQNRDYLIALNIAKRQMAIMQNAAYPAVAAEAALTADAAFPNYIPTQTVVSIATSVDAGGTTNSIRQITIRVRLNSLAGAVLIRLDTYRSNIITFGTGS